MRGKYSSGINARLVVCLDTMMLYSSITHAARALHLDKSSIGKVINGKLKTSGGLKFEEFTKSKFKEVCINGQSSHRYVEFRNNQKETNDC